DMHPDPQTIPTPIPKTDPPSLRKPLRLAMLRAMAVPLSRLGRGVGGGGRQRLLLIRPDHLGDLLCVTPALKFLRAQMPDAHITALVGPWGKAALADNPNVDALQTLEFPGFTRKPKPSLFAPYLFLRDAAQQLRAQQFDAAVILRFDHWWGALLAALAGIPRRIGYDVPEVKPFLTDVVRYEPGRHEVAQNFRLIARLANVAEPAVTPQTFPLEFVTARTDEESAQEFLRAHRIADGERFAVLVPGSGARVKWWRDDGFAHVADALHERWLLKIVIVGAGDDERALAERIMAQSRAPIVNAVGQTTLTQLAALFARAAVAVGTDSGPMHLAVAMRAPSVHLFGPVSAQAFGPWGDPARHIVLTSGLACIACNRLDYGDDEIAAHPCVRLINERQVLAAIKKVTQ
ncbi:MAG: glycosyltransferase family 9 protein, partial [Chloroflexota bacterium]